MSNPFPGHLRERALNQYLTLAPNLWEVIGLEAVPLGGAVYSQWMVKISGADAWVAPSCVATQVNWEPTSPLPAVYCRTEEVDDRPVLGSFVTF